MNLTLGEVQKLGTDMLRDVTSVCESNHIPYFAWYGTLLGTIRHSGPIPWDYDIDLLVPDNSIDQFVQAVQSTLGDKYWVDYRQGTRIPRPFPRIGLRGFETEMLHIDVFRMSGLPNDPKKQRRLTDFGRKLRMIWKAKTIDANFYYPDVKRRVKARAVKVLTFPVPAKSILKLIDYLCRKYEVMSTDYVGRVMGKRAIFPAECFRESLLHPYADFMIRIPAGYDKLLHQLYGDYMTPPPKEKWEKYFHMTYQIRDLKK